jgi:hypothetical protein
VRLVKDVEGENIDPEQPGEGGEEPGEPNPGTPDTPEEPTTPSTGIGAFSVSATKQVTFSPGNLQYHPMNDEWRFAENQWNYIGYENENISANFSGWIDMFFWGRGDNPMNNNTDYESFETFVDWGTNKIGNDNENEWRTLSEDEWIYLFKNREKADSLYGVAQISGANGIVLLPDNWMTPEGVDFKTVLSTNNSSADQIISLEKWRKMEKAGAVFLPAAGKASGCMYMHDVGIGGYYWSCTRHSTYGARCLWFSLTSINHLYNYLYYQQSVRLVKDL